MLQGYLELKLSWELFQKAPETLSDPERGRLTQIASKQNDIEQAILASPEAANVVVPGTTLDNRLAEIRQRYASPEDFLQDLERSDLNEASLAEAVERDLRVESVLERIAAQTEPASAIDAEIFYRLHPESFDRPEARRLRHILLTFNGLSEKTKVRQQLEILRSTLPTAEKFGAAALKHSQCPTALQGGELGVVKREQLYVELEPAAFALMEGEISDVLESPIGLHILRCDEILPSGPLPFNEVVDRIIEKLTEKRRKDAQRGWIKNLFAKVR
jgi:peptidylprolyl isomerase/peptidyl-prolyl cis-trans isomerase C